LLNKVGRTQEAFKEANVLLQHSSNNPIAWKLKLQKIAALRIERRYNEALEALQQYVQEYPNGFYPMSERTLIYRALGQLEKAHQEESAYEGFPPAE
jgi:tetratricopeptide (TPR) repeat protein